MLTFTLLISFAPKTLSLQIIILKSDAYLMGVKKATGQVYYWLIYCTAQIKPPALTN